jgi:tetratricopeptide (TPR) repeat protein
MMPVRELLSITDVKPLLDEDNRSNLFYAQSWALVHLLLNRDPERQGMARYKALSEKGVSQEEAVTSAFGVDVATLDKELNQYVRQLALTAMQWKLPTAVTTDALVAHQIADGLAAPYLAHMQFRVRRYDEAEQRAIAALAAAPRSATANAVTAALRLHQDRLDEAWAALSTDHAYDDFFDHYMIASIVDDYLRAAGPDDDHAGMAQKMFRQHSLAAAGLRPRVSQAWHFVAQAHARLDELDGAAKAIERALGMAPANEHYIFTWAEVLARKKEFVRSRDVLGVLIAYGRSDAVRGEARRLMAEVARYERALALAAAASLPPPQLAANVNSTATAASATDSEASRGATLVPVFRDVAADETRFFATLRRVDCRADGVTLEVDVDGRPRRLTVAAFDQIEFISYRADLQGAVACGPRGAPDRVYVTWRGTDMGTFEITTPSLVVEFTPLGYVPQ